MKKSSWRIWRRTLQKSDATLRLLQEQQSKLRWQADIWFTSQAEERDVTGVSVSWPDCRWWGRTWCNKKSSNNSNPLSKTPDKFLCCRTSAKAFAANCIWKIPCISTSWVQFLYCSRTKQLKKSWQDHRMRSANATSVLYSPPPYKLQVTWESVKAIRKMVHWHANEAFLQELRNKRSLN